jgi:hypothetical protein
VVLDVDATEIEGEKQDAQCIYEHVQGYMPHSWVQNST